MGWGREGRTCVGVRGRPIAGEGRGGKGRVKLLRGSRGGIVKGGRRVDRRVLIEGVIVGEMWWMKRKGNGSRVEGMG